MNRHELHGTHAFVCTLDGVSDEIKGTREFRPLLASMLLAMQTSLLWPMSDAHVCLEGHAVKSDRVFLGVELPMQQSAIKDAILVDLSRMLRHVPLRRRGRVSHILRDRGRRKDVLNARNLYILRYLTTRASVLRVHTINRMNVIIPEPCSC